MIQSLGLRLTVTSRRFGLALSALLALALSAAAWAADPPRTATETIRLGELDLKGRHVRPAEAGLATVLLVHDTLGAFTDPLISDLQAAMAERGVATLAINLSLGETGRMEPLSCNQRHTHRHEDAVEEIDAWLDWLLGQGLGPVVLAGYGRGAAQVAWHLAARANGRAAAAVLLAPTGWTPRQADAEYRSRYAAGLSALLTRIAGAGPDDIIKQVPFLHCGAVDAWKASIQSYYGVEPMRDTPTALAEVTTPTLALLAEQGEAAPEDDTAERMIALENTAVVTRQVLGADGQFSGPAFSEMADAVSAYVQSFLKTR